VLVRYVDGSLNRRAAAWRLGVLLALEYSFSTEVEVTLTTVIVVSLLIAYAIVPAARPRLRRVPVPLVGAYVLAGVLVSPLLVYALLHFENYSIIPPSEYSADLVNLIVPTRTTLAGWHWTELLSNHYPGNVSEAGAYLGLPCLAILAWLGWAKRREPALRFLGALLVLLVLAELGTKLHVDGRSVVTLPWSPVSRLFVWKNVLPVRFCAYVALAAAAGVAWWASSAAVPRVLRVVLLCLAVVAIVPRLPEAHFHPYRPAFFTAGIYRACLRTSDNVVIVPFPVWTDTMLWQAESGFAFQLANGYVGTQVPHGVPSPGNLPFNQPGPRALPLLQWAAAQHADVILVDGRPSASEWTRALEQSVHLTRIGGVYLYGMPGSTAPCAESGHGPQS
jgi:hypothetical protein